VAITPEEIEREKKTLPFGWGRFGKSIEQLAEISEPDESLLATCVAMNPEYHATGRFVPGTPLSAVYELTRTTNVVVGLTNKRVIMLSTNVIGGARKHASIPYEGLEIAENGRRVFVLGLADGGRIKVRGLPKQQQPRFMEVLEAQLRPAASAEPAGE
jgi:Bacterial PH domain